MKITAVRIHNLASIVDGEIDFTQAPLKDAGLFAITGDTGSGKSTFLDAICLALYTKTSRLRGDKGNLIDFNGDSIKLNDPRNLLRKGKWQGHAEVDFIGQDKQHYRARYTVQRAHKKVTGKLKTAQHSLYSLPDETLIAEKSNTLKHIESKIGLNFEQFSRAVLLAQHEFAAFLKATGDERAQLLECLTGTDKFSLIGKRIFERYKEQKDQLALLKASLASYTLLSDDELAAKEAQLIDLKQQIDINKNSLLITEQGVNWYKQATVLEKNLHDAQSTQQQISLKLDAIAHQSEQAKQAQSAQVIKDNRTRFEYLTRHNEELSTQLVELKKTNHNAIINDLSEALKKHNDELDIAKQQKVAAEPIIVQARDLDNQLALYHQKISDVNAQVEKEQSQLQSLKTQLKQSHTLFEDVKKYTTEHLEWLNKHAQLKPLANEWAYYQQSFTQFLNTNEQINHTAEKNKKLVAELALHTEQLTAQDNLVTQNEHVLHQKQQTLNELNEQQAKVNIEHVDTQLKNIDYLKDQRERYKQYNQEIKQSAQQREQLVKQLNQSEQQQTVIKEQLLATEHTLKHSEYALNQARLRASENVEHLRAQLTPDEPCVVCGAIEHPYVANHNQQLSNLIVDFERDYTQAKQQYEQTQKELHQLQTQHAVLINEQTQLNQTINTAQAKQLEIKTTMQSMRSELNALSSEQLDEHYTQLNKQKNHHYELQKQQQRLQDSVNQLQKDLTTQQQIQQKLKATHVDLTHQHNQLNDKHNELTSQINALTQTLDAQLAETDFWQKIQKGTLEIADLSQQVMQYQDTQTQLDKSQKQLDNAEQDIKQLTPLISNSEQALTKLNDDLTTLTQQQAVVYGQRQALFANESISADAYQARLIKNIEQCQTQQTKSQQAHDQALKARDEQAINIKNYEQRISENTQEQSVLMARYNEWFSEFKKQYGDISHEQITILLSLDNHEIHEQLKQHELLTQHLVDANAALRQQHNAFEQHQKSDKPLQAKDKLDEQLEALTQQQTDLNKQQLATNTALEQHNQNAHALQAKQQTLSTMQKQVEQWHLLNKVLGDATGKTMRNLAQTQTLKILLHYANNHLNTLNKRYELTAIEQTLDIAIIDRDMADEQRSVNTLSGGESFLVSLALALGLASLSSNKVSINSLFIDEGFGTLDSETLSIAMDALDSLQAQGRKVGVISHVSQMTERVTNQVHVAKKPGGYSTISII